MWSHCGVPNPCIQSGSKFCSSHHPSPGHGLSHSDCPGQNAYTQQGRAAGSARRHKGRRKGGAGAPGRMVVLGRVALHSIRRQGHDSSVPCFVILVPPCTSKRSASFSEIGFRLPRGAVTGCVTVCLGIKAPSRHDSNRRCEEIQSPMAKAQTQKLEAHVVATLQQLQVGRVKGGSSRLTGGPPGERLSGETEQLVSGSRGWIACLQTFG